MNLLKRSIAKLAIAIPLSVFLAGNIYSQEQSLQHPSQEINKVYLTSSVNNKTSSTNPKNVTLEDKVNLNLVVEAKENGKTIYFSDARDLYLDGKKIDSADIMPWKSNDLSIKWFKVESCRNSYNNRKDGPFKWDEINYKEILVDSNKWVLQADGHPTNKFNDVNKGLGTMRYSVQVCQGDKKLCTPGKESTNSQGIKKDVHRISFRKDNSFRGWLTSFFNLPYIYGSSGKNSEDHQAENYIGADCADLLVAAHRKTGRNIPYTYAAGLINFADVIVKEKDLKIAGTNYYNGDSLLKFGKDIRKEDLILFNNGLHVGAITEDKSDPNGKYKGGPDGIFNIYDTMIHTLFDVPREESIGYGTKFSILRWKN